MGLFKSKDSYLGVDIGNSAVKIVELENHKGRPKLVTYGYVDQANKILTSNSAEARKQVIDAIKKIQREARTTTTNAVAALPSYTVFTSIIRLPKMPKKELTAAVQWEAKKFVPMPLEEMILDWKVLDEGTLSASYADNAGRESEAGSQQPTDAQPEEAKITTGGQQFLKILITAAPKDLVERYLSVFKEAGLDLVSLETESFALERALIGKDSSPVMMIDVGAVATTISVVVDGVPLINRSIDIGGNTITKSLANALNIDTERAEQFKRDFGLTQQAGDGNQVPQRIEFMLQSIVNEVNYVLKLYQSQGDAPIEKVVLAGGSAWLPNMPQYLSSVLKMKVFIGDPWARIMYPMELKPVLQNIGPRLSVCTGLAMREIH